MRLRDLIPMLSVSDIHKSIGFYKDALGFEVIDNYIDDAGKLWWCMMRSGDVELMLTLCGENNESAEYRRGRASTIFYFYPDDVISLYNSVKAKGYPVGQTRVTIYKMKEFELVDPDGHSLWFGQPTSESSTPCALRQTPLGKDSLARAKRTAAERRIKWTNHDTTT